MNPDPRSPWSRLVAAARGVSPESDERAPYGFSTRVAVLAFAVDRRATSLLERFAFRAVGAACLLALASVALNYRVLADGRIAPPAIASEDVALPFDDAIAAVLDVGN